MIKKIVFIQMLMVFSFTSCVFAFEWKKLHDRADKEGLEGARVFAAQNPDSEEALYLLGLANLNAHNDAQAKENFDRMIAIFPLSREARWGEAEVLRRAHELDKSRRILDNLIKDNPDFSPAYITLAYISYVREDFNAAVKLAEHVLAQGAFKVDKSNRARAYLILAAAKGMIAYYGGPVSKLVNGPSVFSSIRKAKILKPDSAEVYFGLGSFYLLAPGFAGRNLEKAEKNLKEALRKDPKFSDAYVRLAQLYKLQKKSESYDLYMKKALEIDPGNELAHDIASGNCKFICVRGD